MRANAAVLNVLPWSLLLDDTLLTPAAGPGDPFVVLGCEALGD